MVYVLAMSSCDVADVLDLFERWVVSGDALDRLLRQSGLRYRRGIYTPRVVLWLMIWQRLQPRATLSHAVRQLVQGPARSLLSDCRRVQRDCISAAPGGYCQAIQKLSTLVPQAVTQDVVQRLSQQLGQPWPGLAEPVYLVDGSTLQLPHTRKLARDFPPAPNQHGDSHWPILRLVVLHEVSTGLALYPRWGPVYGSQPVSEQRLAAEAFAQLPPGATVLADRNFGVFSIAWEAHQRQLGVVVRLTKDRAHKLFGGPISRPGDTPLVWKPSRHDQPQVRGWPAEAALPGRLIAARVGRGKARQWLYLFTTLELPAEEIVALYGQRWHIETDLRSLKKTVHLQQIRARSRQGMEKELLTAVCAYNLVRAVICLAARRDKIEPRRLSFTQVLDVVRLAWPRLRAAQSREEHDREFEQVLDWAAACRLPCRRKRRSYPREIWGRGGHFPFRKTK